MSTPTDQFASLSIDPHEISMTPTKDVRKSAVFARDTLSSFETYVLPSEFEPHTFRSIMARLESSPSRPPKTYWTKSGNRDASYLQWAAYDERMSSAVNDMQTPTARATSFTQKLRRRFDECLVEYDALPDISNPDNVRDEFRRVLRNFGVLSAEIHEDRTQLRVYEEWEDRLFREVATLEVVLDVQESLCQRTEAKIPVDAVRRSSRRNPSLGESSTSLFAAVIRKTGFGSAEVSQPFVLDALDLFSGAALSKCLKKLIYVNGLLNNKSAGAEYIRRFESLQQKARDVDEGLPGPSSSRGGSGRARDTKPDEQPGSKRSQHQQPAESTTKRGRTGGPR